MLNVVVNRPNEMSFVERARPEPSRGEVRVRMRHAAVALIEGDATNACKVMLDIGDGESSK